MCAVLITLFLTGGIVSFAFPGLHLRRPELDSTPLNDTILGLVEIMLLFDIDMALYGVPALLDSGGSETAG